jgi:hypothetical protein
MLSIKKNLIYILLSIFFILPAMAQVKVEAVVDRNEMSEGDTFTLSIVVSSDNSLDVSEPRLVGLKNFDLLNSWSTNESHSSYTNGKFVASIKKKFNYMLSPQIKVT